MDETYDVIVCGTGLKECILSGLMSVNKKKVLHLDRNTYYGGESASLNLTTIWEKFKPGQAPPPEYGTNRDWNIDLIPKFVMACGKLVKILLHTKVTRYLEWKSVEGTYVYQFQEAGFISSAKFIHKVPASDVEALKSNLIGLMEKNRVKNFFQWVVKYDPEKADTWQGLDPRTSPMSAIVEKFGLSDTSMDWLGHGMALYTDDSYLGLPFGPTIDRFKLYIQSINAYGLSPFIYPIYGLGGLPEGFSRLSAIHGGTYMLKKPVDGFEYDANGKVCGVRSGDEVAKCSLVICDPSYVPPEKIRAVGRVIRAICILGAPIPETNNACSCQIIIPQKQLGRKSDVYVTMISWAHCVAAKDKYIAIVSATVETPNPVQEIQPALNLLGKIENQFMSVSDLYEPIDDGSKDNVYVTSSYDATSHFESASEDVLSLWERISGSPLDMTIPTALDSE
mmetsp:Transcript_34830/g.90978  ORF Transcript_34830/g.90978 Transcript_34830/m.90978 type:complete len:451 (-) Transcript_34830:67-1419(-)